MVHALTSPPPLCEFVYSVLPPPSHWLTRLEIACMHQRCEGSNEGPNQVTIGHVLQTQRRLPGYCPAAIALAFLGLRRRFLLGRRLGLVLALASAVSCAAASFLAASFLAAACAGTITSVSRVCWEDQGRAVPSGSIPDISTDIIPSESIPSSSFSRESRA